MKNEKNQKFVFTKNEALKKKIKNNLKELKRGKIFFSFISIYMEGISIKSEKKKGGKSFFF